VVQPRPEDYTTLDALEEARTLAAQDRKLLALDVATMLLPPALASAPRTRLVLTEAIRATKGAPATSLWTVSSTSRPARRPRRGHRAYLRDMAEMPLPGCSSRPARAPSRPATTRGADRADDARACAAAQLGAARALVDQRADGGAAAAPGLLVRHPTIYGGPGRAQAGGPGRDPLPRRVGGRGGRCSPGSAATPEVEHLRARRLAEPADVLGMEVSNFISAAFVGRIEDEQVATDALRMLRVPAGVGYESVLSRLSPRSSTHDRSGLREFIMRDVDGNVDRMRVDLDHLPQVLEALDTTAAPAHRQGRHLGGEPRRPVPEVPDVIDLLDPRERAAGLNGATVTPAEQAAVDQALVERAGVDQAPVERPTERPTERPSTQPAAVASASAAQDDARDDADATLTLDRKAIENGGRTGNGWPGEAPQDEVTDATDVTDPTNGSRSGVRSG
jgi:hypothetical protein